MKKENASGLLGIVLAVLATTCCIGPAIFIIFGTSVSFLGEFSFLTPLRPYFLGVAYLSLGFSFWKLYIRKPDCKCEEDLRKRRVARFVLWAGTVLVLFATFFKIAIAAIYG